MENNEKDMMAAFGVTEELQTKRRIEVVLAEIARLKADGNAPSPSVDRLAEIAFRLAEVKSEIAGLLKKGNEYAQTTEAVDAQELQDVIVKIQALNAEYALLTSEKNDILGGKVTDGMENEKKNHRPGKPSFGKRYVLLTKELSSWGKVPAQQADIAKILSRNLEVGKEYGEVEVFDILHRERANYGSLTSSVQDVTYLFRYYRGLKRDKTHAGYIARNFIRVYGS